MLAEQCLWVLRAVDHGEGEGEDFVWFRGRMEGNRPEGVVHGGSHERHGIFTLSWPTPTLAGSSDLCQLNCYHSSKRPNDDLWPMSVK